MKTSEQVIQEIRLYLGNNGITMGDAASRLGVTQSAVTNILNRNQYFGSAAASRWSSTFGFNYQFLRTGNGSLLPEQDTTQQDTDGVFIPERTMQFFEDLQATCRNLSELANRLTGGMAKVTETDTKKDRTLGGLHKPF